MMRRGVFAAVLAAVAASCLLAACGEKSQALNTASKKPDAAPWAPGAAASNPFFASGWKGGDQAAWEGQIRARNQGQNDYAR